MTELISSLDLTAPVIISPSMSGSLSLPILTAHPEKVKGYIPVAPVYTGKYTSQYPSISVSIPPDLKTDSKKRLESLRYSWNVSLIREVLL